MIERIESAETKDELEKLGKEYLDVDVDKRKGVETIRAELTELAEGLQVAGEPGADAENDAGAVVTKDQEPKKKPKGRQLRHRVSGRVLPWTAALAKKREMQEV